MLLLAVDTSDRNGSIALAKCGASGACEIIEVVQLEGGTFSAQLVPQIAGLLAKNTFRKEDIDGFAVVPGPGSFTGLRIGLAAVKALAEISGKPVAAVSLLEAIAETGTTRGRVVAVMDAGREEVYMGEYELGDSAKLVNEALVTRTELIKLSAGRTVITPNPNLIEFFRSGGLNVEEIQRPGSVAAARIGWKKILAGSVVSPEMLDANYIRRMDGEILVKGS